MLGNKVRLLIAVATSVWSFTLSANVHSEIYKCLNARGESQYSDKPCAKDAEIVTVNTKLTGANLGSQGDFSSVNKSNKDRDARRTIQELEQQNSKLRAQRDKEVAILKYNMSRTANNLAGATWEQSLATEMQAVTQNYNEQINAKQAKINRLEDELAKW